MKVKNKIKLQFTQSPLDLLTIRSIFLLVILEVISLSFLHKYVHYLKTIEDPSKDIVLSHVNRFTQKSQRQSFHIIAGSYQTGTYSILANLYRWGRSTYEFQNPNLVPLQSHTFNWTWPVPKLIAKVEEQDKGLWNWTPVKAFQPMIEALLLDPKKVISKRDLYKIYDPRRVLSIYQNTINEYWDEGNNILIGADSFDMILKSQNHRERASMIRNIDTYILPEDIENSQVTVTVMHRRPKVEHLVSMWHQTCKNKPTNGFFKWITAKESSVTLAPLESLALVDLILKETSWNVVLIDMAAMEEDGWDASHFVACHILGEVCDNHVLKDLNDFDFVPKEGDDRKKPPNVSNMVLDEMDLALRKFDCNYQHLINSEPNERLTIPYRDDLINDSMICQNAEKGFIVQSREDLRKDLKKIALRHGIISDNYSSYQIGSLVEYRKHKTQKLNILAGPHYLGSTYVQDNIYRWSLQTIKMDELIVSRWDSLFWKNVFQLPLMKWFLPRLPDRPNLYPLEEALSKWVWPVHQNIAKIQFNDSKEWSWTPSKIFNPLLEAFNSNFLFDSQRKIFQQNSQGDILSMYSEILRSYWEDGSNIVIGSEEFDYIVRGHNKGPSILSSLFQLVLPKYISGNQITITLLHRKPKIEHLLLMWRELCRKKPSVGFYDWIMESRFTLSQINTIGMVDLILKETDWNVALIDTAAMEADGWDLSYYIACNILGEECEGKVFKGFNDTNLVKRIDDRSSSKAPDVPYEALDKIEMVLQYFDCNYQYLFNERKIGRFKIHYPERLLKDMKLCKPNTVKTSMRTNEGLKLDLKNIAIQYGKLYNTNPTFKIQYLEEYRKHRTQRFCILGGPHKTGSTSLQENIYRWSLDNDLLNWTWPVPKEIVESENKNNRTDWDWTPSKVFYPMMEAFTPGIHKISSRDIFQKFEVTNIFSMYKKSISESWKEGHNVVIGTEAFDMIAKDEETGISILKRFPSTILPDGIDGKQITISLIYRSPKVKHLVSIWHQDCVKENDDQFFKWITTRKNNLRSLDSLAMVDLILRKTDWNVELIDLEGLKDQGWDISNFVACEVLEEYCNKMKLIKVGGVDTVVKNVRSTERAPDISIKALNEMDEVLRVFDCNYQYLLDKSRNERLKIHSPKALDELMNSCHSIQNKDHFTSREKMKNKLIEIAHKYGVVKD